MDIIDGAFVLELQHIVVAGLAAIFVKVLDVVEKRVQKLLEKDGDNA